MADRRKDKPPPPHPPPSPPPPPQTRRTLTIGVEIELLVLHSVEEGNPPPTLEQIAAVLREKAGVAAIASKTGYQPGDPPGQWRVTTDGSIGPISTQGEHNVLELLAMGGRRWTGAEVVSCIFHDDGALDAPWSDVIKKVLWALKDSFEIRVNDTMGYHVHVGVVVIRGFSLEELQKLSAFVIIYEGQIDKLHADHRSTDAAIYCQSNRKSASFAPLSNTQAIRMILRTTTIPDLVRLMCPGKLESNSQGHPPNLSRYYKLNLQSVRKHGTVEWRQCEGTIDLWKACRWPRLVSAITRKIIAMPMDEFLKTYDVPRLPALLDDHPELRAAWDYKDTS